MPAMVLAANPATVTATFVDTSGATVDPGTVLVTVTRLDGTTVVEDVPTTSGSGAAARTYTLTSAQTATLDTLTVTFASSDLSQSVSETVEVVGALLFTEAEARLFPWGNGTPLSDTAKYTDAMIEEARARITEQFETICGVSFVPRYRLDTLSGTGYVNMALPRMKVTSIRSVEYRTSGAATWTAYDADDLADLFVEDYGWILRETRGLFTTGRRNLRIGYEYGFTTPPLTVKRAAIVAVIHELVPSNVDPRAISISSDVGSTQLFTEGFSGRGSDRAVHSIPYVNNVLKQNMYQIPVTA